MKQLFLGWNRREVLVRAAPSESAFRYWRCPLVFTSSVRHCSSPPPNNNNSRSHRGNRNRRQYDNRNNNNNNSNNNRYSRNNNGGGRPSDQYRQGDNNYRRNSYTNNSHNNNNNNKNNTSSSPTESPSPSPSTGGGASAPLPVLEDPSTFYSQFSILIDQGRYQQAVEFYEASFDPSVQSLLELCGPHEVRDVVLHLCRAYTSLGRMDKVRQLFVTGLRDLSARRVNTSPLDYQLKSHATAPPTLSLDRLDPSVKAPTAPQDTIWWDQPSLLTVSFFNMYLEVLTLRKNFDRNEVLFVLQTMREAGVEADALTYHYLIELHVRAGYNPKSLWTEMIQEKKLTPLSGTLRVLMQHVVPYVEDSVFVVEVTREALRCGSTVVDKKQLSEVVEQWLFAKPSAQSQVPSALLRYPPEYVMWLMLELELRCVLDKASFPHYIQKQHVAELLVQCAKNADTETAEKVLALMDRHAMTKTADILALMVWCWSSALQIEKALDMVELMARKGHLESVDAFKRYVIESLRLPLDRNPLMTLAESIQTASLLDRAYEHLQERKKRGDSVSVDTLDLLVLASCKMQEDRRALYLVSTYASVWAVAPRANTYNSLLAGNASGHGSMLLRNIYGAMKQSGVSPNIQTFRMLIRQAVLLDDIDEAVYYLQEVTTHSGLRVEVEMILPILERAARAGDVETVNQISQYSLDCDIGIDNNVLNTLMGLLTEAGQSVDVLKGHQPLHEALRTRSNVGRQRARNQIAL